MACHKGSCWAGASRKRSSFFSELLKASLDVLRPMHCLISSRIQEIRHSLHPGTFPAFLFFLRKDSQGPGEGNRIAPVFISSSTQFPFRNLSIQGLIAHTITLEEGQARKKAGNEWKLFEGRLFLCIWPAGFPSWIFDSLEYCDHFAFPPRPCIDQENEVHKFRKITCRRVLWLLSKCNGVGSGKLNLGTGSQRSRLLAATLHYMKMDEN